MKRIIFFMFLSVSQITLGKLVIPHNVDAVEFTKAAGLVRSGNIKFHLGCGESYLRGYVNVDFPSSEHTVQNDSVADIYADISTLSFSAQSVDEVRLHHLFEHFNRQTALALLCSWHNALKVGGIVHIETPDFMTSISMILNGAYSYKQKQCIIRHVFGSHEAYWAYHYDGWYEEKYRHVLGALGYEIISAQKNSHLLTHNITIIARKIEHRDYSSLMSSVKQLLRDYMVDESAGERKMHDVWYKEFEQKFVACHIS